MSSQAGSPPPDEAGAAAAGPSPAARRRWRLGIVAAVFGVCVASILAALALGTDEPAGYSDELQASVEAACRRAAPDVDEPAAACECAYQRLEASVPFDRLEELDEELRGGGQPPAELVRAVEGCQADQR